MTAACVPHLDASGLYGSSGASSGVRTGRRYGGEVRMIERRYGALLDGASAGIPSRVEAYDLELEEHSPVLDLTT